MAQIPEPLVDRIGQQCAESILTAVYEHDLPPVIDELMPAYQTLKASRPRFIWKWVHHLAPSNTLPCVDADYRETVPIDKTIAILYITLLDDVLEQCGDRATFAELRKLPDPHATADPEAAGVDADYVDFADRVWTLLIDRLQRGPTYSRYEELFRFDIRQGITAIEYSDLAIRQPELATMADIERYESHNMVMFAYADIDLMYTTREMTTEIGTIRDAVHHAQRMARIGNWVSTWERELRDGDYSSAIVVYALEHDILTPAELPDTPASEPETLDAIADRLRQAEIEQQFLDRWDDHYDALCQINETDAAIDLTPYIDGTEEVLRYHIASTGLK